MRHKIVSVCLLVCLLLMLPTTAFAQTFDAAREGSVAVTLMERKDKTPIVGAELSLYYVASVTLNGSERLNYTYTAAFENCGTALDDQELAAYLDTYVASSAVPAAVLCTDGEGSVVFEKLPLGLYFIKQTNSVESFAPCNSFLVTVPIEKADGYAYDVNASPKTDVVRLTDITIEKVWNTDVSTPIADSVSVQLLRGDKVVETVTLSDENDWKATLTDLPESDLYSVVEVNIPQGFTATYLQKGYEFTVTNSAALIQTGQLVWPIPVLAIAGLFLLAVGALILRREREHHV